MIGVIQLLYGDRQSSECSLPVSLTRHQFTALTDALHRHSVDNSEVLSSCYTPTSSEQYQLNVSTLLCVFVYLSFFVYYIAVNMPMPVGWYIVRAVQEASHCLEG